VIDSRVPASSPTDMTAVLIDGDVASAEQFGGVAAGPDDWRLVPEVIRFSSFIDSHLSALMPCPS